ncbi:MAG: hypothetical protein AMXMBFR53_43170 [Gemmatimonadota bacterium]
MRRGIRAMEGRLGVELPHLWEMERATPGLLVALARALPLLRYRRKAPCDLIHLARIGATLAQDCGDCLQIAVNVARGEGVPPAVIEAAVRGWEGKLTTAQAAALGFGKRVAGGLDGNEARAALAAGIGEAAMIELAMAVASAQLFPVLRRGMGLAHACRLDLIRYAAP